MINKSINSTTKARIIRYFEGAGLDYSEWSSAFNMHFGYYSRGMNPFNLEALLDNMNAKVLRELQIQNYEKPIVLDLGCGLGTSSRYMAKQLEQATFYGLTITPWQIKYGAKLTAEAGLQNQVHHLEASYTNIPMPDNSVDAAFAIESACYATGAKKLDFLKELHRVLKPGGRFVITDGFRKHSKPLPWLLDKIYQKNLKCWALEELANIHACTKALKTLGFEHVHVEDASWKVAPSFAYVPWITLKFLTKHLWKGTFTSLDQERINNATAPILGMLMGASRPHFGYYILSGRK